MKEEKVGKKPKGMVVVISVGKPGGKKPEREADPDTKKKAFTGRGLRESIKDGIRALPYDQRNIGYFGGLAAFPSPPADAYDDLIEHTRTSRVDASPTEEFRREMELLHPELFDKNPYDDLGMQIMSDAFLEDSSPAQQLPLERPHRFSSLDERPLNQPGTGYNRRMLVEGEIPFEDPHMELRLDPEERELDRLQGLQGDSPNIRPRLHALHGSKPGRLVTVPDPRFADEPELIPAFRYRELYSWDSPLDPNNEIITHEGQRYEKIPRGMRRNPNYGRTMQRPRKDAVQQRRGEGIIQRSEDDDILSDILKGDLSNVDFCDCCSIMENTFALMKAKKKSKPFHGYNPKRHHKKGGLSAKGRAKFKRETGANLKPPVTTKPSKLKPGSKKAKRRKSFCARMGGMKGPTSKKGKLTPKGAALKRWNC